MTMARGLTASRPAVQPATPCVDTAKMARVERMDGRTTVDTSRDERTALRREYAWVEAAATAAFRGRV